MVNVLEKLKLLIPILVILIISIISQLFGTVILFYVISGVVASAPYYCNKEQN